MTRAGRPPIHQDAASRKRAAASAFAARNRAARAAVEEIGEALEAVEIDKLTRSDARGLLMDINTTIKKVSS